MNNDQFRKYIDERLANIRKSLADKETDPQIRPRLQEQEQMLTTAQRMGKYSSGQEFRRWRRDYERRLKRLTQ